MGEAKPDTQRAGRRGESKQRGGIGEKEVQWAKEGGIGETAAWEQEGRAHGGRDGRVGEERERDRHQRWSERDTKRAETSTH